mgnify:CR=1 FL=1
MQSLKSVLFFAAVSATLIAGILGSVLLLQNHRKQLAVEAKAEIARRLETGRVEIPYGKASIEFRKFASSAITRATLNYSHEDTEHDGNCGCDLTILMPSQSTYAFICLDRALVGNSWYSIKWRGDDMVALLKHAHACSAEE